MRRDIKTTLFLIMLSVVGTAVMGQAQQRMDTMRLSLKQAQDYAMQNSSTAKNSLLSTRIAKMRNVEILSTGLPQINSSVKYQNTYNIPVTFIPAGSFPGVTRDTTFQFGTSNNAYLDINLSQLIVDGRYFIGLKAAKTFMTVAREQEQKTEIDVRDSIATTYYTALVAGESLRIIEETMRSIKQLHYENEEMYKAGFVEELDVDRLSLTLSNLESKLNQTKVKTELANAALKAAIGLDLSVPVQLTDSLEGLMITNPALTETNFNYKDRVEYKLLELQHRIKGFDAQQTRAAYYPSLSAYVDFGVNAQRTSFDFFDAGMPWYKTGYVAIQLSIPIFDSYKNGAAYQQKRLERLKAANDMDNFKLLAQVQVQAARSNYLNAISDYESQKRSMALAQKIFDKVKEKNKNGLATSFELTDAERSLSEAEGNYVTAIYTLLVNKTGLDKALGKY